MTIKTENLYVLIYDVVDDYVRKRQPHRDDHIAYARASYQRGELLMGGAFSDPPDTALLVFRSRQQAEQFVANDPYARNGLVRSWKVREWVTVVW